MQVCKGCCHAGGEFLVTIVLSAVAAFPPEENGDTGGEEKRMVLFRRVMTPYVRTRHGLYISSDQVGGGEAHLAASLHSAAHSLWLCEICLFTLTLQLYIHAFVSPGRWIFPKWNGNLSSQEPGISMFEHGR